MFLVPFYSSDQLTMKCMPNLFNLTLVGIEFGSVKLGDAQSPLVSS